HVGVLAVDVRNRTHTAKQRSYTLLAARLFQHAVNELAHSVVLFKISVNEFFGFALFNSQLLRQPEGREAVDNAEVHRLGAAAVFGVQQHGRHAKDLRGGERVNVVAAAEGFHQQRIVRKMRQQAQFNLGIIGGEQYAAGFCDESSADLPAQFGANGNVLQVGIGGREPSRCGACLVEGGVQPVRTAVQQQRQGVHVSALQL